MVVEVGGLADEGVHHACIDLCGGGVIDKGDSREGWQAVRSAGLGSIGVCGACFRRPSGLRAYIETPPFSIMPAHLRRAEKPKRRPHSYRALQP